eukprot:GHVN01004595.1.p1 GENE.GHVN01004595.1~~GHVN01004595.1.p1  ORF type:complete len:243 (-),score=37.44 GHVN01004595.1:12-740(-)
MNSEIQTLKEKRRKEKKKVLLKFGEKTRYDISLGQIQKYGLDVLLISRVPLCFFLCFLFDKEATENFLFYDEIDNITKKDFQSKEEKKKTLEDIYNMFIKPGAEFEINIISRKRRKIKEDVESGNIESFEEAKNHVAGLLKPLYEKFLRDKSYFEMCNVLDETNYYSIDELQYAIVFLKKKIDETLRNATKSGSEIGKLIARRIILTRKLVHVMLLRKFGMDFVDETPDDEFQIDDVGEFGF